MTAVHKVLLVDDHAVVRAGFRMLLSVDPRFQVIAEAERGEQAIQLFQNLTPDILIMDVSMPGIGGLEAISRIVQRHPDARILVFSIHDQQAYVSRALAAGARGYISKTSAPEILFEAIETIVGGEVYIERSLIKPALPQPTNADHHGLIAQLSPREFDIFRLLAAGLPVQMISEQLCLGPKTVANYATQIKKKLRVTTVTELAHIAIDLALLQK